MRIILVRSLDVVTQVKGLLREVVIVQLLCHVWLFVTPWTAACQASLSFTISQSFLKLMPIELVIPSNHLILCHPLLSCPQSSPALGSCPVSWLFASGGQSIKAFQFQHQSFQWIFRVDFLWDWLVWSPFYPRNSQESSPALQCESISSLVLRLLYGPAFTSVHEYWKKHRFDYMDLCQ